MPTRLTQADVDELAQNQHDDEQAEEAYRDLTVRETAAVATMAEGVSGEADPSDFVLPYLSLVQKMSQTGTPGTFLKSTGDETDHIDFVILHVARTRTFYDGDAGELVCASRDRVIGRPRAKYLLDELGLDEGKVQMCRECPHFHDDQFEKLACKFDYLLTLYDLKAEEPLLFRAKGASLKVWRQRLAPILQGQKPPWFAAFEMTVKTVTNKRGQTWFEPDIKSIQQYDQEQREAWRGYAQRFGVTVTDEPHEPEYSDDSDDLPF